MTNTETKQQTFFRAFGDRYVVTNDTPNTTWPTFRVECLYQMFKERLAEEGSLKTGTGWRRLFLGEYKNVENLNPHDFCKAKGHDWDKWNPLWSGGVYQRRICLRCGFVQDKRI